MCATAIAPSFAEGGNCNSSCDASAANKTASSKTGKSSSSTKGTSTGASTIEGSFGRLQLPAEIGRIEAPRDMNIFSLEPTVINEGYYASGKAERHQNIGTTLPPGAPIPDIDDPTPVSTTPRLVTPIAELEKKIDAELTKRLSQEIADVDSTLELKLVVASTEPSFIEQLKSHEIEVGAIDEKNHTIQVRFKSNKAKKSQKVRELAKMDKVVYLYSSP